MNRRHLLLLGIAAALAQPQPGHAQNNSVNTYDIAESGDRFGAASATGDFNGDGFADVAIGVPGEDIPFLDNTGAVEVIYGSATGLASANRQFWTGHDIHVATENDAFGSALAAGDINGDGFDDIAVGAPGKNENTGAIRVLFGTEFGLTAEGAIVKNEGVTSASPVSEYGSALAIGDFDGDGFADLAVGSPKRTVGDVQQVGRVLVYHGASDGFRGGVIQTWTKLDDDIDGDAEPLNHFGEALSAGDFNGDGIDDLAIGEPGRKEESLTRNGGVHILLGSTNGLTSVGSQFWYANTKGMVGGTHPSDEFGAALASGDFDADGFDDLAIGVPRDDLDSGDRNFNAGSVHVIYGAIDGLAVKNADGVINQFWQQGVDGLEGESEEGDWFGGSIGTGDFDGDGADDLAIGVPTDKSGQIIGQGAFHVLYGRKGTGLSGENQHWRYESTNGLSRERLGGSLSSGDFDGDGTSDLVVGAAGSNLGIGEIDVFIGKLKNLLDIDRLQIWAQPVLLAADDDAVVDEDSVVIFDVLANDLRSANTLNYTVSVVEEPQFGTVERVPGTPQGNFSYRGNEDFHGTDHFTYLIRTRPPDTKSDTTYATVGIEVTPINDPPTFEANQDLDRIARAGQAFEFGVQAVDVDGDVLEMTGFGGPDWLQISDVGDGIALLSGTPSDADVGERTITIRASDGQEVADTLVSVTTLFGVPGRPVLIDPADAADGVTIPVTLSWGESVGAATYRLQVTENTDFSSLLIDTTGIADLTISIDDLESGSLYFWRVQGVNDLGNGDFSGAFRFTTAAGTASERENGVPSYFALRANYPNPFNPMTTISYELPRSSSVRLVVYDLFGRVVTRLVDESQPAGHYDVVLDASLLASGTYFYRLEAQGFVATRRMTIAK